MDARTSTDHITADHLPTWARPHVPEGLTGAALVDWFLGMEQGREISAEEADPTMQLESAVLFLTSRLEAQDRMLSTLSEAIGLIMKQTRPALGINDEPPATSSEPMLAQIASDPPPVWGN
jgi:hypothetical protein